MVEAYAIEDHTQNERARVAVDRDGVRLLDLDMEAADALRQDRSVDERIRQAVGQLTQGRRVIA